MKSSLVFVYGTLKRGGSNHRFLSGQQFVAAARTVPGYTLCQPADYPGLIEEAGDTEGVVGEVWSVSPICLAKLDQLEGTHMGLYRRIPIALADPHAELSVETYLYLRSVSGVPRIGSNWTEPGPA